MQFFRAASRSFYKTNVSVGETGANCWVTNMYNHYRSCSYRRKIQQYITDRCHWCDLIYCKIQVNLADPVNQELTNLE